MALRERDDIDDLLWKLKNLYADGNFDSDRARVEVEKVIKEHAKKEFVRLLVSLLRTCYDNPPELRRNICKKLVLQTEYRPVDSEKVSFLLFILSHCDKDVMDAVFVEISRGGDER